jgi:hypothetical protein
LRVRRVGSRRMLELVVANRGDVAELLEHKRLRVTLRRGQRIFARLESASRQLLPRTSGIVQLRYAGRVRGRVSALVELSSGSGGGIVRRTFHLRF